MTINDLLGNAGMKLAKCGLYIPELTEHCGDWGSGRIPYGDSVYEGVNAIRLKALKDKGIKAIPGPGQGFNLVASGVGIEEINGRSVYGSCTSGLGVKSIYERTFVRAKDEVGKSIQGEVMNKRFEEYYLLRGNNSAADALRKMGYEDKIVQGLEPYINNALECANKLSRAELLDLMRSPVLSNNA